MKTGEVLGEVFGDMHVKGEVLMGGKTRKLAGVVKERMENARRNAVGLSSDDCDSHYDGSGEELPAETKICT